MMRFTEQIMRGSGVGFDLGAMSAQSIRALENITNPCEEFILPNHETNIFPPAPPSDMIVGGDTRETNREQNAFDDWRGRWV